MSNELCSERLSLSAYHGGKAARTGAQGRGSWDPVRLVRTVNEIGSYKGLITSDGPVHLAWTVKKLIRVSLLTRRMNRRGSFRMGVHLAVIHAHLPGKPAGVVSTPVSQDNVQYDPVGVESL